MSIRYVATVLDCLPVLSATDTLVLIALADYASDETRECWPSVATIARRARIDRRTVQRRLRSLEERGYIRIAIGGHQYGENTASAYRLLFDHAGEFIADVAPAPTLSTRAAPRRGGGGNESAKGGIRSAQGRRGAAPSVIDPSLIQEAAKSRANGEDRIRAMTDAELEERARAGKLSAGEERERELRKRMASRARRTA